ncbi:MAG: rhodanese-like domain-containing protein [Gammaproteobacteria bacterium]
MSSAFTTQRARAWPFITLVGLMLASAGAWSDPIWIDVRTAAEFAGGHLPGATHIPVEEIGARIRDVTPDPDADLRLYCGIGVRAQIAKVYLESLGYRNVTNEGGYADLAARQSAAAAGECREAGPTTHQKEGSC